MRTPCFPLARIAMLVLSVTTTGTAMAQTAPSATIVPGERLSNWLLRQPADLFIDGLIWSRPEDMRVQRQLKKELLAEGVLSDWLRNAPVTGRAVIARPEVRWLQAHPKDDPILREGDGIFAGPRPQFVTLLKQDGSLCHVPHTPQARARDYVEACDGQAAGHSWAWLTQPDGQTQRVGLSSWNDSTQMGVAPGAWIWSPADAAKVPEAFSDKLVKFLGTQGPAPDPTTATSVAKAPAPTLTTSRQQQLSASDWGGIGLLQTPTARMESAGHMRITAAHIQPYTNLNVMFQPLDWVEAGFRYTQVSNRIYGITTRDYTDKSFDLKLRLLQESAVLPELALGWRDLAGTGMFSSEYVVGNKRTGNFDWSLGLGWGYLGNRGQWSNPLGALGSKFKTRPSPEVGEGGKFSVNTYFKGPVSPFGGVQWQSPIDGLRLKLEYEGNNYQHEPLSNNQKQRTGWNAGLAWLVAPSVDWSVGVERGNRLMTALTFNVDLSTLSTPKLHDPAPVRFTNAVPATLGPSGWTPTAEVSAAQSGWKVTGIQQQGDALLVDVDQAEGTYKQERLERIVPVLHKDSPPDIKRFVVNLSDRGLHQSTQEVDRYAWIAAQTQPSTPATRPTIFKDVPPAEMLRSQPQSDAAKGTYTIAPSYTQILGGPDAFLLYQLGVSATAEYRFSASTWLSGTLNLRVADNYDNFKYTAPSDLPRVRTYQREFTTASRLTLPNLQLTHVEKLGADHFVSLYGGALEWMYAGVGAEWLYRPWRSPLAVGVDVNRVRQRDFHQNLQLRDYGVTTGHATVYWDTGWQDVNVKLSAGQYLAGDKGATLDFSRRFSNGVSVGAYGTKTNVKAKDFGEGSFDKGVYVNIPFDAMLATSSKETASLRWTPLTRDGGARLDRQVQLYELTSLRDPKAMVFRSVQPVEPRTGAAVFE